MTPHHRRIASLLATLSVGFACAISIPARGQDTPLAAASDSTETMTVPGANSTAPANAAAPMATNKTPDLASDSHRAPVTASPVLAFIDFETESVDDHQDQAISQELWNRLLAYKDVPLLPREDTRRWLLRHDLFPFAPYGPQVPLDRATRALNAAYLVTGHLNRVDDHYIFDASVFSVARGRDVLVQTGPSRVAADQITAEMAELARRIHAAIMHNETLLKNGEPFTAPSEESAGQPEPKTTEPEQKVKKAGLATGKAGLTASRKVAATDVKTKPAGARTVTATVVEPADLVQPASSLEKVQPVAKIAPTTAVAATTLAATTTPLATTPAETTPTPTPQVTPAPQPETTPAPVAATRSETATPTSPSATAQAAPKPDATPAGADQTDKAQQLYKEAQALDPSSAEYLDKLRQAADLAPANLSLQEALARAYYLHGQYPESLAQTERALRDHPNGNMLKTIRATSLFELGRFEEARQANEAILATTPSNHWARFNLALALTMLKSPEATAVWHDYIARAKDDPKQKNYLEQARQHLAAIEAASPAGGAAATTGTTQSKAANTKTAGVKATSAKAAGVKTANAKTGATGKTGRTGAARAK